jgi:hypothetical protein
MDFLWGRMWIWTVCTSEAKLKGRFMRISLPQLAWSICVGAVVLAAAGALDGADMQGAEIWPKEAGAESAGAVYVENDGRCAACCDYVPQCALLKVSYNLHHPVAIYHPQVYNYRYYFNIVGLGSYHGCSNCRNIGPYMGRPQEMVTPGRSLQKRMPAAIADATRASPSAQKYFQK